MRMPCGARHVARARQGVNAARRRSAVAPAGLFAEHAIVRVARPRWSTTPAMRSIVARTWQLSLVATMALGISSHTGSDRPLPGVSSMGGVTGYVEKPDITSESAAYNERMRNWCQWRTKLRTFVERKLRTVGSRPFQLKRRASVDLRVLGVGVGSGSDRSPTPSTRRDLAHAALLRTRRRPDWVSAGPGAHASGSCCRGC